MEKEDEIISVVIPIYNMRDLLERNIQSVRNQTYRALQILLVDDGSTDGSREICDKFAADDARITVIHQRNRGIAGATSAALERASGEYVAFVDSDDYISPIMLETLLRFMRDERADIVQCGRVEFTNPAADFPEDFGRERTENVQRFIGREAILSDFCHYRTISRNLASRLFRRELLEGVQWPEGLQTVDVIALPQILVKCSRYVFIDGKYYYVYARSGSVSRSFSERTWQDDVHNLAFFDEFIPAQCPEFMSFLYFRHVSISMNDYVLVSRSRTITDKKRKLSHAKRDFRTYYPKYRPYAAEYATVKNWKRGGGRASLFWLSPTLYVFALSIYQLIRDAARWVVAHAIRGGDP